MSSSDTGIIGTMDGHVRLVPGSHSATSDGPRPRGFASARRTRGSGDTLLLTPEIMASNGKSVVHLIDDEKQVLKALSRLLNSEGYETAGYLSAKDFMGRHDANASGCVVLDVSMAEGSGLEVQQWLTRTGSLLSVIFVTSNGDIPTSVRAMKAGAVDFLTRPMKDADLVNSVRLGVELSRQMRLARAELAALQERLSRLTPRETEVMRYVISGWLNKHIAAQLGTVEKTIKVHRARVMEKMAAQSLPDLVRMTERAGIQRVE